MLSVIPDWSAVERAVPGAGRVAACYAATLLVACLPLVAPATRRRGLLIPLGLGVAMALYREGAVAVVLCGAIAYFMSWVITARTRSGQHAALRWRLSVGAIVAVTIAFFWAQWLLAHRTDRLAGTRVDVLLVALSMWTAIRLATFFWEVGSGRIPLPGVERFWLWFLFPFTIAGPVARMSEFNRDADRIAPGGNRESVPGWLADAGLALLIMLAGMALSAAAGPMNARGLAGKILVVVVIAPWGFLLQASGFFRSMEVFARVWRVHLPPSFNRPFGRPNISEFWANWNITVTAVFRDYLFYNRWGRRRVNVYVNSMILFGLVGAWHALNAYWILWGLFHGIGFCLYMWYKQNGARLKPLFQGRAGNLLAISLTYLWVVSSWAVPPQVIKLWSGAP